MRRSSRADVKGPLVKYVNHDDGLIGLSTN